MATTKLYKRLPPDSGTPVYDREVHLSGFRDIKITSRVIVERQIADFMKLCEQSDQPAARMLIGSWGEGKTEAFYRYIKPKGEGRGHSAFLLTSRSIANAYAHYEGLDTSEARLLLAAVFHVLSDEGIGELPRYRSQDLDRWLEECLGVLDCGRRKLFLFVDEVEQLLHEPRDLRRLMLGIKQILDGKFSAVMPGGTYPGSVFVFFACTPEAYGRIATDPDLRQVFGGHARRMDRISVEAISLAESVHFIHKLLEYCYKGSLPRPLPVTTPGILCALATIAKRNMGHMVSLTTRLLSSMSQDHDALQITGPEELESSVQGRSINIEGHDTKCFEDSLYRLILRRIDESGVGSESMRRLFTAMLFDQRAFTSDDVADLLGRTTWREVDKLWVNFMREALSDLGYSPGLLEFHQLGGELQQEALFDNLEAFTVPERKGLFQFAEKVFTRRDIEDLLTNYSFNSEGQLNEVLLGPANTESIQHLFGPLPSDEADRLLVFFEDLANDEQVLFRLPKDLIEQLFPPPCPPGLEFIRDASERFNLWRRATLEFSQRLAQDLPRSLAVLGSDTGAKPWRFADEAPTELERGLFSARLLYEKDAPAKTVELVTWVLARQKITAEDAAACEALLAGCSDPPHIVLFLSGEPPASDVIENLSPRMKKRICAVTVHPTYMKQMLASAWHLEAGGAIYDELLTLAKDNLLRRDIGLYSALDRWLLHGRVTGLVVDNPALSAGAHAGLVNALRLLLNACGMDKELQEVFEWNRTVLRKLVPYGSKRGLVPETDRLESLEGFRALVGDLQTNGLASIDSSSNRPTLVLSPCEMTILEELGTGDIHKRDWGKHLAILATPETIVEDVYVEALRQRGLVTNKRGRGRGAASNIRTLVSAASVCEKAKTMAEDIRRRINTQSERFSAFESVAHLVVAKERDVQLITLRDVMGAIEERLDFIVGSAGGWKSAASAVFLNRFIEECAEPVLRAAVITKRVLIQVSEQLSAARNEYATQRLPNALSGLGQLLGISLDTGEFQELRDLAGVAENARGLVARANTETREALEAAIGQLDAHTLRERFWFNSLDSEEMPHNYYAHVASVCRECFEEKRRSLDRLLSAISDNVGSLIERRQRLYRQLTSKRVEERCQISKKVFEAIRSEVQPALNHGPERTSSGIDSVAQLSDIVEHRLLDLRSSISTLEEAGEIWDRLHTDEHDFFCVLEQARERVRVAESKFDLPDHAGNLDGIKELLTEVEQGYAGLQGQDPEISPEVLPQLRNSLSSLKENCEATDKLLESELWVPFAEKRRLYLVKLGRGVAACEALGNLPQGARDRRDNFAKIFEKEGSLQAFLDGPKSCAEQVGELEEAGSRISELLGQGLTKDEKAVFESIVGLSAELGATEEIEVDRLEVELPEHVRHDLLGVLKALRDKGIISLTVHL